MEKCWNDFKIRFLIGITSIGILISIVGIRLSVWVWVEYKTWFDFFFMMFVLFILGWYIYASIMTLLITMPKYKVDKDGIEIKYFPAYKKHYTWDEISEISVCDVRKDTKSNYCDFIIRVVIGDEPKGPRNINQSTTIMGNDRWRTESYMWKHWRKLLIIEYTEDKYLRIREASGKKIQDYRRPRSMACEVKLPK